MVLLKRRAVDAGEGSVGDSLPLIVDSSGRTLRLRQRSDTSPLKDLLSAYSHQSCDS